MWVEIYLMNNRREECIHPYRQQHICQKIGVRGGWMSTSCLISARVFDILIHEMHDTHIFMRVRRGRLKRIHYSWIMIFLLAHVLHTLSAWAKAVGEWKKLQTSLFVEQGRVKYLFCCYWQSWYIYERFAVLPTILQRFSSYLSSY